MRIAALPLLLVVGGFANTASAAEAGIDLGTTGLGLQFSVPVQPTLNARFGIGYLNYSFDTSTSNVNYDAKLKLRTLEALLDYFPTANQFRLTGGLVYNGNKIDAIGRPSTAGTYTIDGITYGVASAGTLDGRIDFRNIAPYIGIGWGNSASQEKGWGFSADLGVMFQGSPSVSLTSTGCTASPGICASLANSLDAERRELEDDVNDYKYYPVARIGLRYRF
jgi:hypothetical protein